MQATPQHSTPVKVSSSDSNNTITLNTMESLKALFVKKILIFPNKESTSQKWLV